MRTWKSALVIALLGVLLGCDHNGDVGTSQQTTDATAAVEMLLGIEMAGPETRIYVFGPLPPGAVLQGFGASLAQPGAPGTYYAFVLDDLPMARQGHPMRYAWVEMTSGRSEVVAAEFLPVVLDPVNPVEPLAVASSTVVQGVPVDFISGNTPEPQDISHKPPVQVNLASLTGRRALAAAGLLKLGLVFDAGDENGWRSSAEQFAADADSMGGWLQGYGFTVERISQYSGNSHSHIEGVTDRATTYLEKIDEYKETFENAPVPPPGEYHEFVVYVGGHGDEESKSVPVYKADGSARDQSKVGNLLSFRALARKLARFPESVRITVFIDACYSGIMADEAVDAGLDQRIAGATVITTSDATSYAPTGRVTDSGTEDFLDDSDLDADGDGVKGDIRDRAQQLRDSAALVNDPQVRHWPADSTWGCLDIAQPALTVHEVEPNARFDQATPLGAASPAKGSLVPRGARDTFALTLEPGIYRVVLLDGDIHFGVQYGENNFTSGRAPMFTLAVRTEVVIQCINGVGPYEFRIERVD